MVVVVFLAVASSAPAAAQMALSGTKDSLVAAEVVLTAARVLELFPN